MEEAKLAESTGSLSRKNTAERATSKNKKTHQKQQCKCSRNAAYKKQNHGGDASQKHRDDAKQRFKCHDK